MKFEYQGSDVLFPFLSSPHIPTALSYITLYSSDIRLDTFQFYVCLSVLPRLETQLLCWFCLSWYRRGRASGLRLGWVRAGGGGPAAARRIGTGPGPGSVKQVIHGRLEKVQTSQSSFVLKLGLNLNKEPMSEESVVNTKSRWACWNMRVLTWWIKQTKLKTAKRKLMTVILAFFVFKLIHTTLLLTINKSLKTSPHPPSLIPVTLYLN